MIKEGPFKELFNVYKLIELERRIKKLEEAVGLENKQMLSFEDFAMAVITNVKEDDSNGQL